MTEALAPAAKRLESLDFVRGCALFGILLMNINGMGLGPAYDNPTIAGGANGINLWTWLVINIGFEGTQRALFSILFGAGVILLTSRLEASGRADASDIFFRRNLWLIAFGLVNAWVILWTGDILYYYGITALFLYAFRKMSGRTLLGLAIASLVLGAAWSANDTRRLINLHADAKAASVVQPKARSDEQKKVIEEWDEKNKAGPPPTVFAQMRKDNTDSYWSALTTRAGIIKHYQSWWLYRFFFDIFGMMMLGMALFKLGVLTLEARTRTYLAMMGGGYAVGLTGNILEARWIMDHGFTALAYTQASISYDVSRLAMTMGHLGLLMLFLRSGILPFVRRSMAAVGRMALTNYLTHSVIALIIFVFLGYWGALERHQLYFIVLAIWIAQFIASPIWLRNYHFGPVEWLWRYLTYGKKPEFAKGRSLKPEPVAV